MNMVIEDWVPVINKERVQKGLPELPKANVKVIREVTFIVVDLWCRRCEVKFGKTCNFKIKNQFDSLACIIDTLLAQTYITIGRGRLHFITPPKQGISVSLMKVWINTLDVILKQLRQRQQQD